MNGDYMDPDYLGVCFIIDTSSCYYVNFMCSWKAKKLIHLREMIDFFLC